MPKHWQVKFQQPFKVKKAIVTSEKIQFQKVIRMKNQIDQIPPWPDWVDTKTLG
jgi:hypothetical protein